MGYEYDKNFGWFTNAMMAMHPHTYRKYSQPKPEPLSEATINYYLERLGSSFKWDDGFEAGVK